MFIPRGEALYENLATSYVLVDVLIDDLCEGGFSGLVEVVLRQTDAHIVIDRGRVVIAVEKQNGADYDRASVQKLAQMSRRERGRLSVYRYSKGVARALAGRIAAHPLYTGLSSDFTDLNRMIAKFLREPDREWFIEIVTVSGITSLVHIENDRCRIITSGADQDIVESGQLDITANPSLRRLLDECNSAGGTFDVYFRRAGESDYEPFVEKSVEVETAQEAAVEAAMESQPESVEEATTDDGDIHYSEMTASAAASGAATEAISLDESVSFPSFMSQPASNLSEPEEQIETQLPAEEDEFGQPEYDVEPQTSQEMATQEPAEEHAGGLSAATMRLLAMPVELQGGEADAAIGQSSEEEEMAEIKRLMGEIARAVEEAVKAVEPGDSFSMSLRAGQLKLADRYPFLDPFGSEFEYMDGEIVFVGKATSAEFANGLTEAIKLATASIIQTSLQPARLRAFITEDLNKLLERNLSEFQLYNLDRSIEDILSF